MNQAIGTANQSDLTKQSLRYGHRLLSLYRLLLSVLLLSLYFANFNLIIGQIYPALFTSVTYIYVFIALASFVLFSYTSLYQTSITHLILLIDIIFAIIVIHSSGGLNSDLSIILLVIIASSGLLVNGRYCVFIAFTSTLGIFAQEYFGSLSLKFSPDYTQGITLALAIFATAGLSILINKRARESEELALQRSIDIQNLTTLNEYIIEQMKNGVIVVDRHHNIVLHNIAAEKMLGGDEAFTNMQLQSISEQLHIRLVIWQEDEKKPARIKDPGSPMELQPFFIRIGENSGTLIFIEDSSAYTEEFQSLKQASLGRLAGSIAHEIRNPLSAIQHAAQLIDEDQSLAIENKRMVEIINKQSNRVNRIIENVMQLSNQEHIIPENIDLEQWFKVLCEEFVYQNNIPADNINSLFKDNIKVFIDSSQLYQIIWNILSNSAKYGKNESNEAIVFIDCYLQNERCIVELCDDGKGIPANIQAHMFEPFYSGSSNSSGLGLYIVRELCEMNRIDISYHCDNTGQRAKPYFRLAFNQSTTESL